MRLGAALLCALAQGCTLFATFPTARTRLRVLLDKRVAATARGDAATVAVVDAKIERFFERDRAIMVTDMTGFTARTKQLGIIPFLAKVRLVYHLAEPIVKRHGGVWVKIDADDLYVKHDDANELLAIGRELLERVRQHDAETHDDIGLKVGLGFGPTIEIEKDVYGDSINTASKLGEDLGREGELLVTEQLYRHLSADNAQRCLLADSARGAQFPFYVCH